MFAPGWQQAWSLLPPAEPSWVKAGRFPHAVADEFLTSGVTLREEAMLEFVNRITDEPGWWERVFDQDMVCRWRSACGSEEQQRYEAECLDQKCFDYCIGELCSKAMYYRQHGVICVLDVMSLVAKADSSPSDPFWNALRAGVKSLESARNHSNDCRPGPRDLVVDLLDPSLFPVEYGTTRLSPYDSVPRDDCASYAGTKTGCLATLPARNGHADTGNYGPQQWAFGKFQWLPTDVTFATNRQANIEGYINNLHPRRHAQLYPILAEAIEKAVPLWNECLSSFDENLRIPAVSCSFSDFERPNEVDESEWPDRTWIRQHSDKLRLIQPSVAKSYVPRAEESAEHHELPRVDLSRDFPRGLQVIFKLTDIHLTPAAPSTPDEEWHIQGTLNEHICATALFYYDEDNLEDSYIEFRQRIDANEMAMKCAEPHEYEAAEHTFGVEHEGSPMQNLGRVLERGNRILAFPNVLQHRATSCSLRDPSRPGHRKVLALFLVDPHDRIPSTRTVPPQQRDWWAEEVRKVRPFSELPVEIFDLIVEGVEGFPVGWDKACEIREALVRERRSINEALEGLWQEVHSHNSALQGMLRGCAVLLMLQQDEIFFTIY